MSPIDDVTTSTPTTPTIRETREWWVVHDGRVVRVRGLSCAPDNPDVWWFPSIGYSLTMGYHVFKDQVAAVTACKRELQQQIAVLDGKLRALDQGKAT